MNANSVVRIDTPRTCWGQVTRDILGGELSAKCHSSSRNGNPESKSALLDCQLLHVYDSHHEFMLSNGTGKIFLWKKYILLCKYIQKQGKNSF